MPFEGDFTSLPAMLALRLLSLLALSSAEEGMDPEQPLTLEAATAIALVHANEMIQAREDVLLVDADYMTALSAVLPRVDLDLSAGGGFFESQILEFRNRGFAENTPDDNPPVVFGDWQDANANGYVNSVWRLGLSARQLIFDGGRWWTAIDKAKVDRTGRDADLRAARNLVRARVAQTFFALERARRSIDVLAAQIELDHAQVKRAGALLRAGRGAAADVAAAKRNLAADEIQRVQAQTAEGQARRTFNLQLGLPPRRPVRLVMPETMSSSVSRAAEVPPLDELLRMAREHRPELASQGAVVRSAERDVGIAQADYWPSLALEARYNRSSRRPDRIFANPLENFTASLDLVLQWNLFEGRATTARVDQARVQVRKAQAQLEALERQTLAEVEDARQRWFDQERTFGFAQEQISAAKDALRLARGLYEAGRGTSLELRTAELELTRAQIAAINARLDAETARADLAQAVGIESWAE